MRTLTEKEKLGLADYIRMELIQVIDDEYDIEERIEKAAIAVFDDFVHEDGSKKTVILVRWDSGVTETFFKEGEFITGEEK